MISIITPTYNHEKYIGECIESALNQTYQDWEMIIVDDGSLDQTASVISNYKDPRIKYFRQNHLGPWKLAQTYNFALSQSKGSYIAILEGDDYWPKDKLQVQYVAMENSPNSILSFGECRNVSQTSKEIDYFYLPNEKKIISNDPVGNSLYAYFSLNLFIQAVTIMIKKSALERIGGFQYSPMIPAVDYPTCLRLCLEGIFLPIKGRCLGCWRRHMHSISINYPLEALKGMAAHNLVYLEQFSENIRKLGLHFEKEKVKEELTRKLYNIANTLSYEKGLQYLSLDQHKLAKRMLLKYLCNKPNYRQRFFIYLGLISSIIRIDLVYQYRKYRDKAGRLFR